MLPTPRPSRSLIASLVDGTAKAAEPDPNDFYCLALSSNAARVIVRDYIEEPLPQARANAAAWFRDLRIASTNRDDWGHPVATFPHWLLGAAMTVPKAGNQPDWNRVNELVARLRHAALTRDPLPESILATCLLRLRAEGERGFRPARMALIKLCLIRKGVPVSEKLNPLETNPAYICGELLAVFDQIQRAALGKLKATVVDKYYGGLQRRAVHGARTFCSRTPRTTSDRFVERNGDSRRSSRSASPSPPESSRTSPKVSSAWPIRPGSHSATTTPRRTRIEKRWAKDEQRNAEAEARKTRRPEPQRHQRLTPSLT